MSIVAVSELLAGARPDTHCIAIEEGGHPVSLARFRADIAHNSARLSAGAVRRGAVVCDNGYWFLVGMLALIRNGADVILPPTSQAGTLKTLALEFDALVTDSPAIDLPGKIVLQAAHAETGPFHLDSSNRRIELFTSGSTGEMKRVEKSLSMFEREARVLEEMFGAEVESIATIGTVTHQHVFGMTFRIMWPLTAGRTFHGEYHVMWEPLMDRLKGPSILVSSPAQLTRLGGLAAVPAANRPRLIVTAGAPLPAAATIEATEVFGCVPTEIFGSTEAGIIAWRRGVAEPPLWQPVPSVEVAAAADGALMLRSPHASGDGWCEQADRISFAPDGRFRLEGRTDRIAKIEGKRVSLVSVERGIAALSWVDEAAVVVLGENRKYLGAVVKLSKAGIAEFERLGKFRFERMLRRELGCTEDVSVLPRRWRFVDFMPMDGLGKRRIRDVVAMLEQSI